LDRCTKTVFPETPRQYNEFTVIGLNFKIFIYAENKIIHKYENLKSREPESVLPVKAGNIRNVKIYPEEKSVEPGQEISSETTTAPVKPDFSVPGFLSNTTQYKRFLPTKSKKPGSKYDIITLQNVPGRETRTIRHYPNPFNPATTIKFLISPQSVHVKTKFIKIFNSLGQLVAVIDISHMLPGLHEIRFNGRDFFGNPLPSGLYFVSLQIGQQTSTIRMTLVK